MSLADEAYDWRELLIAVPDIHVFMLVKSAIRWAITAFVGWEREGD